MWAVAKNVKDLVNYLITALPSTASALLNRVTPDLITTNVGFVRLPDGVFESIGSPTCIPSTIPGFFYVYYKATFGRDISYRIALRTLPLPKSDLLSYEFDRFIVCEAKLVYTDSSNGASDPTVQSLDVTDTIISLAGPLGNFQGHEVPIRDVMQHEYFATVKEEPTNDPALSSDDEIVFPSSESPRPDTNRSEKALEFGKSLLVLRLARWPPTKWLSNSVFCTVAIDTQETLSSRFPKAVSTKR